MVILHMVMFSEIITIFGSQNMVKKKTYASGSSEGLTSESAEGASSFEQFLITQSAVS